AFRSDARRSCRRYRPERYARLRPESRASVMTEWEATRTQQPPLPVQLLSERNCFRPFGFRELHRTRTRETLRVNRRLDRESRRRGHQRPCECCNLPAALEV